MMDYTVYEKVDGYPYAMEAEEINECFHDLRMTATEAENEIKDRMENYNTYYDVTGELRKRKIWIEKY